MLESSFQHLRGIGVHRERELWRTGITSWERFEASRERQLSFFREVQQGHLRESRIALAQGRADFFARRLPTREHYRIALTFPEETLFLDIETTGLSLYYDEITLVGWSIGAAYGVYVKGTADDALRSALSRAKTVVTFNGSLFDLPFLRRLLPEVQLPEAHVDLRFLARAAGLAGPQKVIERKIGFEREADLGEMNGQDAPLLWHSYKQGDRKALKRLIQYNHADVEGMKLIFDEALGRLLEQREVPHSMRPRFKFASFSAPLVWRNSRRPSGLTVPPFQGPTGPAMLYEDLS